MDASTCVCAFGGFVDHVCYVAKRDMKVMGETNPPMAPPKRDTTKSSTDSPPTARAPPTVSGRYLDSLVAPVPVDGLLGGHSPIADVRIRPSIPRGVICVADSVFLVGEFTIPIGDESCQRCDTGEYMLIDGDFVFGNRDRTDTGPTYILLCQSHGADYLKWFAHVNCSPAGCLEEGVLWE